MASVHSAGEDKVIWDVAIKTPNTYKCDYYKTQMAFIGLKRKDYVSNPVVISFILTIIFTVLFKIIGLLIL